MVRYTGEKTWLRAHILHNPSRVDHNVYGAQVCCYLGYYVCDRLLVSNIDVVELDGDACCRVQLGGGGVPEILPQVE